MKYNLLLADLIVKESQASSNSDASKNEVSSSNLKSKKTRFKSFIEFMMVNQPTYLDLR
ncbi:hypothetical protein [Flectobacillus major]|uniref:hypothetical protein n=1 Tax=Flectobacillus major TaxID=103 RepID=UPI000428C3AC|nr:hypothetical protein [Flectobacillus major]